MADDNIIDFLKSLAASKAGAGAHGAPPKSDETKPSIEIVTAAVPIIGEMTDRIDALGATKKQIEFIFHVSASASYAAHGGLRFLQA